MRVARLLAAAAIIALTGTSFAMAQTAPVQVEFWHGLTQPLGGMLEQIAADFNASQKEYRVNASFKGQYPEVMTGAIAAFRAGNAPGIVQMFEVGTATMMAAKGAVKPVYELMQESGLPFDPNAFVPAVKGYYSTPDGKMLSMPFNSSTPIMFYNKAAFDVAGDDRGGEEAEGGRHRMPAHHRLADLDTIREFQRHPQRPAGDQGQRHGRARHRAQVQQPTPCQAHPEPHRHAKGWVVQVRRARLGRRCALRLRRMRHHSRFLWTARPRRPGSEVRLGRRAAALLARRQGRAEELDSRRRQLLGAEIAEPQARGIQR